MCVSEHYSREPFKNLLNKFLTFWRLRSKAQVHSLSAWRILITPETCYNSVWETYIIFHSGLNSASMQWDQELLIQRRRISKFLQIWNLRRSGEFITNAQSLLYRCANKMHIVNYCKKCDGSGDGSPLLGAESQIRGAGSQIWGAGSQIWGAGSQIRWDPAEFNHWINVSTTLY